MNATEFYHQAISKLTDEISKKANLAIENLTMEQFAEAVVQAVKCGDFMRHVTVDRNSQAVTYVPYRELERVKADLAALKEEIRHDGIEKDLAT